MNDRKQEMSLDMITLSEVSHKRKTNTIPCRLHAESNIVHNGLSYEAETDSQTEDRLDGYHRVKGCGKDEGEVWG